MFDVPFDVGAAVNAPEVAPDANTPFKVVSKKFANFTSCAVTYAPKFHKPNAFIPNTSADVTSVTTFCLVPRTVSIAY